jgi:hypothetical protein
MDATFVFIDQAYDHLDSFEHIEDVHTWDTIKRFWQNHYKPLFKELRKMIKIPDKRDENRNSFEKGMEKTIKYYIGLVDRSSPFSIS